MSIYVNHMKYEDFIKNEIKTFGFLAGLSSVRSNFEKIANNAKTAFSIYNGKKKYSNITLTFTCDFDLIIERINRQVLIECIITPDFSLVSYSFVIYENSNGEKKALRKFHFDFDSKIDTKSKKPIYHLQYGGKPSTYMTNSKIECDHIEPWLSSPRIHNSPINLMLLFDFILNEFPCEKTIKVIETSEWRKAVKNNEDAMLREYYMNINSFFTSKKHKSNFLYRDFIYGKTE